MTWRFLSEHPLTRGHRIRACGRFASWQIRSRLASKPIVHPWVNGTRLVVTRGMTGATGNIYAGLHEFDEMGFLLHFLRPASLFVDAGANVGSYTILAAGAVGAKTVSLEPVPATFEHLRRNVDENRLHERVDARRVAVGMKAGTVAFTSNLDTMNRVAKTGETDTIVVEVETLDALLAGRRPEMVKIDVEGFEAEVLEGAPVMLGDPGLKALLIESNPGTALARASRHGFVHHRYDPLARALEPNRARDGSNALMLRDLPFIRERVRSAPHFEVLGRVV